MMNARGRAAALACLLIAGLAPAAASAHHRPYEKFYGEYRGVGVSGDEGKIKPRDLTVNIAPAGKGYSP